MGLNKKRKTYAQKGCTKQMPPQHVLNFTIPTRDYCYPLLHQLSPLHSFEYSASLPFNDYKRIAKESATLSSVKGHLTTNQTNSQNIRKKRGRAQNRKQLILEWLSTKYNTVRSRVAKLGNFGNDILSLDIWLIFTHVPQFPIQYSMKFPWKVSKVPWILQP